MIDFKEISYEDDTWELFARDFLAAKGFYIEYAPDRGADSGKDMLVTENLSGNLNTYQFRWLVSCKHFASSGSSVRLKDEPDILERLSAFRADGFIGLYSTIASSGLNNRLNSLRNEKTMKDFAIFDHKLIENLLITVGYSHLLMRYFPNSYKKKPLHFVTDQYEPLKCKKCDKDILLALFEQPYGANLNRIYNWDKETGKNYIQDVYCACAYECDGYLERIYAKSGLMSGWIAISDLVIPIEFLRYLFATMNRIRDGIDIYTDDAYKKEKAILIALSQRVLRYITEEEKERYKLLLSLPC
jgi:hypothetical protein